MNGQWTPHDTRDEVIDFVTDLAERTELPVARIVGWTGIQKGKFYDWKSRYGKVNEHNANIPRDHWLTDEERARIIAFHHQNPLEGYRRLTFMMLDADVVAASPSSVYRVLRGAGLLDRWNLAPSRKGTGFEQPDAPHRHWHVDIAYIKLSTTSARCSTAAAATSSTGRSGSR
jgi:hypothetical protein